MDVFADARAHNLPFWKWLGFMPNENPWNLSTGNAVVIMSIMLQRFVYRYQHKFTKDVNHIDYKCSCTASGYFTFFYFFIQHSSGRQAVSICTLSNRTHNDK